MKVMIPSWMLIAEELSRRTAARTAIHAGSPLRARDLLCVLPPLKDIAGSEDGSSVLGLPAIGKTVSPASGYELLHQCTNDQNQRNDVDPGQNVSDSDRRLANNSFVVLS